MPTIKDYIEKYLQENANAADKKIAAKQIVDKLKALQYSESKQQIPVGKLLEEARTVKNAANDNHLELIQTVVELLEQED